MTKALLLCSTLALATSAAHADSEAGKSIALHAGVFDVGVDEAAELGFELRLADRAFAKLPERHALRPIFGFAVTEEESAYFFGGVRYEVPFAERWQVAPSFAVGLYDEGDGKDLGGPVEFRSGIELSVEIGERSRLGLMLYHLSNAVLYDKNPGEESLVLVWSRRLGAR